jgi:twitching motility two-component system response regulator PilH
MPRILVVEDSPSVLLSTSRALAASGYEVVQAADGEEALRLAAEQRPSLVLLDVILPRLNGYEVCRQLKAGPATAHIPVIMVTGKTKERDRYWGMEQGADAYITKPLTPDELLAVVGRFVPQAG